MTSFAYNGTTLVMEQDPLAPRDYDEEQSDEVAYDSDGDAYAYDHGCMIYRTESLVFPYISWENLSNLVSFIDNTLDGSYNKFIWSDRTNIIRTARYKNLERTQISPDYFKVTLTLEVLI